MGKFGYHVIDADGHGGDLDNWQSRLPAQFAPKWEERKAKIARQFANLVGVGVKQTQGTAKVDAGARAGMTDPKARIEDMDLEGIDQTVMFPGGAGEEWAGLDKDFAVALCRTLNDARGEFLKYDPKRLKSVAKLPLIDPASAAAELRRCVTQHGMVGMVTPQHIREKNLNDPSLDIVWQTATDLNVTVCIHGGGQAIDQVPLGVDRWKSRLEVHAFTHPVGQMAAVMAFTVGGILHRFPKLRVAFLEAGTGWLPFWLERLDEHWELTPEQAPIIDRKPSEYFLSGNCFIGMDPEEKTVPDTIKHLGEDVVVYASDYYHWDCAFPDTVKIVSERTDMSASAKKKVLETNPRRLYNL